MEITSPEEMAKFADDVRCMEGPFTSEATEAFRGIFAAEYRRLRASALESGEKTAVLNVTVRCCFDPVSPTLEMITAPAPSQPKPRRKAVGVPRPR